MCGQNCFVSKMLWTRVSFSIKIDAVGGPGGQIFMNMKKYFELGMISLLEKDCIDNISVIEIIEEVGSCKGTFYKHYIDKHDLCLQCLKNQVYVEIDLTTPDWNSFFMACLATFRKSAKVVLHAFESSDINSVRNYNNAMFTQYLFNLYEKNGGDLSKPLVKEALTHFATFSTDIAMQWLNDGCKVRRESVAMLLQAVAPQSVYKEIYMQTI